MHYLKNIDTIDREIVEFNPVDLTRLKDVKIANIFIDQAVYQMTVLELKCMLIIFSTATYIRAICDFHGRDLVRFLGMEKNKNAIALIYQAFIKIENTNYSFFKGGETITKNYGYPNFFSALQIDNEKKDIRVGLIDEDILKYIGSDSALERNKKDLLSTTYQLQQLLILKRPQSIRLYLLVKRLLDAGRKSKYIEVPLLKTKLGIENKYLSNFNGCMKNVLEPALNEINQKTDLSFEINPERKEGGRKYTGITLLNIKAKETKELIV